MNPRIRSVGRSGIYLILFGALLSIIALIVVVSESGNAQASTLCTVLVYVGYWPMLVMGWNVQNLFTSFWLLPVNLIGWGLIGLIAGWFQSGEREV